MPAAIPPSQSVADPDAEMWHRDAYSKTMAVSRKPVSKVTMARAVSDVTVALAPITRGVTMTIVEIIVAVGPMASVQMTMMPVGCILKWSKTAPRRPTQLGSLRAV